MKTKIIAIIIQILLIVNAIAIITSSEENTVEWPTNWINIDNDPTDNGPSDDFRDVKNAYYAVDDQYLYFRLECYAAPNFTLYPDGRYKWFIDIDDPHNMGSSGGSVYEAEYMLFIEDSPKSGGGDGIGDIYLLNDVDGDGLIGDDWSDYQTNPGKITDTSVSGYRIDGNCIDLYILLDNISNPTYSYFTWATDQEDPNLDSAPNIDRSSSYWDTDLSKADISIEKYDSVDPICPGGSFTYTLQVTNHGPHAGYNIHVVDTLPTNLILNSATPSPTGGSYPTFYWDIASLAIGETIEITLDVTTDTTTTGVITNTAVAYNDTHDPLPGNNQYSQDTTILKVADLSILKSDSADPVLPGEIFTYTLNVSNNGLNEAENVIVTDTLPESLTFISANPAPTSSSDLTYTWDLSTLAAGSSTDIIITVQVENIASTTLTNIAQVTSDTYDSVSENNIASEDTTVGSVADLSITKTDDADLVFPGESFTYTLELTNNGPDAAANVVVSDTLPEGLLFRYSNPAPSSVVGSTLTWEFSSLSSGGSETIYLTVEVGSISSTTVSNTAEVTSDTLDLNLGDNSDSEDTPVGSVADLSITKTDSADPVIPGETFDYNIQVTNNGPDTAINTRVADTLPQGVSYISANPAPSSVVGSTLTWEFSSLSSGNSLNIILTVQVENIASTVITNNVQVASDTYDLDFENNADSEDTTIGSTSDLSIVKSDSTDIVHYGETFTYTLEVTNNGPDVAANVEITDTLPQEVSFVSANSAPSKNIGSTYTWSFTSINVGETKTITIDVLVETTNEGTITNTAQVTSDTVDTSLGNNIASQDTYVDSSAELSVVKTCNTDTAIAGDNITYTINVTNHGPNSAENIIVIDALPEGVTFSSSNPEPSQNTDQTYEWDIALLEAYQSYIIIVNVTVNNGTTGTISNQVTVTSDTHDSTVEDNDDEEDITVRGTADLSIQKKSEAKDPIFAGDKITYILNVTNHGPDAALNVNVTDILPQGVTFTDSNIAPSGSNNSEYYWMISSIDVNQSVIIKINVTINTGFYGEITNIAYVDEYSYDPQAENNQDDEKIIVDKRSSNNNGGSDSGDDNQGTTPIIEEDQLPTAKISGIYTGTPGEEIQFDATESHDNDEEGQSITRFDWKFSDEQDWQENFGATPKYTYLTPGFYNVTLRVFDDEENSDTNTTTVIIIKPNHPPSIPEINGPENGTQNVSYNFTVVSTDEDGDEIRYIINWGDGTSITDSGFLPSGVIFGASHKWIQPGTYTITITAGDNDTISTDELTIEIEEPDQKEESGFPFFLLFLLLLLILLLLAILEKRRRDKKKQEVSKTKPSAKKATPKQ